MASTAPGRAWMVRRDRRVLIELIVRAGFVDLEWLRAATGRQFDSPSDAVAEYLNGGLRVPLSPLLAGPGWHDEPSAAPPGQRAVEDDPMVRYLLRDNPGYLPVPVFDDHRYRAEHPDAAEFPGRARGHFLKNSHADTPLPVPCDWGGPAPRWGQWRKRMLRLAVDFRGRGDVLPETSPGEQDERPPTPWARQVALADRLIDWVELEGDLPKRRTDLVSVLIPTINDWRLTCAAVGAVLANSSGHDLEVVIVDNGSNPDAVIGLAQVVAGRDPGQRSVRVIWMPENLNFALGTNLAFAHSSGSRIVLLNNDTAVQSGWLDPLLDELRDLSVAGVQPLLLYGDGTVQTAGTGFPNCGGLPSHLLVEHPAEDARRLRRFDVSAVTAAALAMRATEFCRLRGLDPRFINAYEDVDLCLRAIQRPGSRFRVATDSVVMHFESRTRIRTVVESNRALLWNGWRGRLPKPDMAQLLGEAGFEVIRWDPGVVGESDRGRIPVPVIKRHRKPIRDSGANGGERSSLRWALKAPWSFNELREAPGEAPMMVPWHRLVESLAQLLRSAGDDVVIDSVAAHQRRTSDLDEVVVVLGPQPRPFQTQPGRPNFLVVTGADGSADEAEDAEGFELGFERGFERGFDEVIRVQPADDGEFDPATLVELAHRLTGSATAWWRNQGSRIGLVDRV